MPNHQNSVVSVIIPAYRAAEFISEALLSVARQTFGNWEVIVVEDGTNDGTAEIVGAFAREHAGRRIVYHPQMPNRGVGPTRNAAMQLAQGAYFAFLDHDDYWQPEHLADALARLDATGADVAFCDAVMFDSRTKEKIGNWGPTPEELGDLVRGLYARNFIAPSTVVMRREVVSAVGPFDEDPGVQSCEDHDYWLRAAEKRMRFCYLPRPTCWYRKMTPTAATAQLSRMFERDLRVLNKHRHYPLTPNAERHQARSTLLALHGEHLLRQSRPAGIKLLLRAWLEQPHSLIRLRRLVSVLLKSRS